MKQGRSLITFVMAALAVALAVYFGVYVYNTFNDPYTTTLVSPYTADDSAEADGLLVREETVLPAQGGIADVTRGEGEKVGIGQTVALVYQSAQAQADQAELEGLETEIELLESAAAGSSAESTGHLDGDVLESMVALRSAAALGDYNDLEDQVKAVKGAVLRRAYTYDDGLTAADLSARLTELRGRYASLRQQTASATTQVRAPSSGIFSALVDGCESVTPETALQFTPSGLRSAMSAAGSAPGGEIGKLITSNRWYFACTLPTQTADRLAEGRNATVRFTGDFSQDVDMRVEHISEAEGGSKAVVLSTDRFLSRTTLLRRQTAELIFDSWEGLRIPKESLRMDRYTYTDTDTSQEIEATRLGVYALVGGRLEFKGAEVVTEGSDYYVVRPTSTGSKALRAGDEIVVRGTGLYEGQLLQY